MPQAVQRHVRLDGCVEVGAASELGARYVQTLHEWALWALDRLDAP